jgi:mono/diheme cytochrome c family protein
MKKQYFPALIAVGIASAFFVLQSGTLHASSARQEVSYAQDIQPIFNARCDNCHMGNYPSEGLDLSSYEGLMAGSQNGLVVVPGNADDSLLVEKVARGEMPKRGPHLTEAQVQLLTDWVDAGALNN